MHIYSPFGDMGLVDKMGRYREKKILKMKASTSIRIKKDGSIVLLVLRGSFNLAHWDRMDRKLITGEIHRQV